MRSVIKDAIHADKKVIGDFDLFETQWILHECSFLLNLLNRLGKRDKMRGLPSILSLFRSEFNKFNNIGARVLDSIYHMTLKILKH